MAFYVDYGSVFSVNLNNPDREKITQLERIMKDMAIIVNHANSPQAKGRVERCNSTMQDRLVKEMRLAGISSIEEANQFVQQGDFIEKHNAKFAIPALQVGDAHRSTKEYDLYKLFCTQEERVVTNDYTVRYKGKIMQLAKHQIAVVRPKNRVTICEHLDGKITICLRGYQLNFKEIGMQKIGKLSPVDYVSQENANGLENRGPNIPLDGSSGAAINNQNLGVENQNFSCC